MEHPLKHWQHEYNVNDDDMLSVRVSMSRAANAAEACRMALGSMTPPKQIPDASVFKYPIWTTWARYKARVNQEKVLKYAREISDRCLPRSVMEIDDRWQVCLQAADGQKEAITGRYLVDASGRSRLDDLVASLR